MSAAAPPTSGNKFSISVLSTHSSDSSPSLLVAFPDQRYLFNTPEAISRIALQSKVGLRKVGNVFLGSVSESAGLPGFILSSVEAGNRKIEVAGPVGTDHYLASCRFFTRRDQLSLKITTPPPASASKADTPALPPPILADTNLNVYALPLPPSVQEPSTSSSPLPSLKRKRSQSPAHSPRPKSPPGARRSSRSPSPYPDSTEFDPSAPGFDPSRLSGAAAEAWRNMVIRDMFRGKAFEPTEPTAEPSPAETRPKERKGQTPAYQPHSLPAFSSPTDAVSYLVVGPLQQGKFLPTEATKRGVPAGKMFSRLKNGERVWIRPPPKVDASSAAVPDAAAKPLQGKGEKKKDRLKRLKEERLAQEELEKSLVDGEGEGKWVTPEECMEAGQDASAFLVLNIPSTAYLDSFASTISSTLLSQAVLGPSTSFRAIFYLLGPGVVKDQRFQDHHSLLRSQVPSEVQHLVTSADQVTEGKDEVTFVPSALLNLRLSKLDNDIFNVPKYSYVPDFQHSSVIGLSTLSTNTHFASSTSLQPTTVSPLGGEVRSFNFEIGSQLAEVEASRLKGLEKPPELQERGQAAWKSYLGKIGEVDLQPLKEAENGAETVLVESQEVADAKDLKVTPLGTGSAIPSKYRNVSSTLIHIPKSSKEGQAEEEYILLDAGEGTWGQLTRRFGTEGAEEVLSKTKMIFISHLHQDHHAGLSTLLRVRARLTQRPDVPLTIVAPSTARTYLHEQHELLDLGLRSGGVRFIDNYYLEPGKALHDGSLLAKHYDDLLKLLDLEAVTAVPVLHRCRAWGIVITHRSGWRIVFSGDTMPCEALVEHGAGASLLIHEATIEDDLPEVAAAKGHSTFAQAIDIAARMHARHLLLTHFSARYPKLPPASSSSSNSTHQPIVATAFDLMTLRLSDFWKIERYREALDALLSWDEAEEGKVEAV